jgi:hypothetical protein
MMPGKNDTKKTDLQAIPNSSVITFANRSFSLIFLGTFRGVKPSSLISVIVLFLGVKTTGVDVLGVFSTEGDVLGMLPLGCVFLTMLTSR